MHDFRQGDRRYRHEPVAAERRNGNDRRRGRRSRIEGELSTERIWAWLTVAERAALEEVATENNLPIASVIREAVNEFVADYSERKIFRHG
jgi:hypothetical protein